jgi:hypothetical protein
MKNAESCRTPRQRMTLEQKRRLFRLRLMGVPAALAEAMVRGAFRGPYG